MALRLVPGRLLNKTTRESKKKTEAKRSAAWDRAAGSVDSAPRPERPRSRRERDVVTCCESDTEKQDKKGTHTAKEGRKQREAELRIQNLRRRGRPLSGECSKHTYLIHGGDEAFRQRLEGWSSQGRARAQQPPTAWCDIENRSSNKPDETIWQPVQCIRPGALDRKSGPFGIRMLDRHRHHGPHGVLSVEERKPRWRSTVEGYRDRRQTTDGIRKTFLMSDMEDVNFDSFLIPKHKYPSEQKPASRKTYGTVATAAVCARNLLHSRPAIRNTRPNGRSDVPWFTVFGIGREKSASEAFGLHYLSSSFRLWTRTWIGILNRWCLNVSCRITAKARYVGKAAELIVRYGRKAVQHPHVTVAYCCLFVETARMKEYSETALVVSAIDDAGAKLQKVLEEEFRGKRKSSSFTFVVPYFKRENKDPLSYKI
ncbi:hypothetical protein DFH08DRAFT_1001456 [Mycena albidolilacea]|uniref:Uncharacterized protein n=1 Tax=Mycena albidolilacea TaxID=1033008 RepID=A0AAD7A298_9AGAR|nr:hypothetical protein DFH08DRAFT_1001456 [Mycena albidolilacea]